MKPYRKDMGEILRRREILGGKIDLATKGVMAAISAVTYNGSAQQPTPAITVGTKTLVAGTDYTYSYSNNINAGTATCTVTGKGKYKGDLSGYFTINKAAGYITLNSTSAGSCAWNSTGSRTVTSSHGGTITVSSSNTTTCAVSISGSNITITGKNYNSGSASTITVTCASTTNYTAASKTFSWTCTRTAGSITLSTSTLTIAGAVGTTGTFTISARTGSGTLTVSSASTSYVTASISDTTITCTSVADGSSVVTVTQAASGNYTAASATCTVTAEIWAAKGQRVGGRIFYINTSSTGNTYKFYNSSGAEITDISVSGLADAYTYDKKGTGADKFYVYDNTTHTTGGKSASGGLVSSIYWGYYNITTGATSDTIGSGKTNTNTILAITDTSSYSDSIFKYIKACRDENLNGCNDWFIASKAEQDQLRSSGLVNWYSSKYVWSSVEYDAYRAYFWSYINSYWDNYYKNYTYYGFAARAF